MSLIGSVRRLRSACGALPAATSMVGSVSRPAACCARRSSSTSSVDSVARVVKSSRTAARSLMRRGLRTLRSRGSGREADDASPRRAEADQNPAWVSLGPSSPRKTKPTARAPGAEAGPSTPVPSIVPLIASTGAVAAPGPACAAGRPRSATASCPMAIRPPRSSEHDAGGAVAAQPVVHRGAVLHRVACVAHVDSFRSLDSDDVKRPGWHSGSRRRWRPRGVRSRRSPWALARGRAERRRLRGRCGRPGPR